MRYSFVFIMLTAFFECQTQTMPTEDLKVSLLVLGTVQDAGSPHIGCEKECCAPLFDEPDPSRKVVSLGLVDHENNKTYLFEATPDLPRQIRLLQSHARIERTLPDGIFITHAHIGHYTGLMHLGREALGAKKAKVYVMPKLKKFLETNGPWSQLVELENIQIHQIENKQAVSVTNNIDIIPFLVPHRDEFSETVGYKIVGPSKSVLFIPDIDKWSKWKKSIVEEIKKVDYAFLDATFFDAPEIDNRDISEIPHPFVIESMHLLRSLPPLEKKKVHFIHFNHTNPLLNAKSTQSDEVFKSGFRSSKFKAVFSL